MGFVSDSPLDFFFSYAYDILDRAAQVTFLDLEFGQSVLFWFNNPPGGGGLGSSR